jgi:uncharacterized repeat protein (TIGR03803 family)
MACFVTHLPPATFGYKMLKPNSLEVDHGDRTDMTPKSSQPVLKHALTAFVATLVSISSARAANQYKVLHYFSDHPAQQPNAALVADRAGNLYGTAPFSSPDSCGQRGCGVVFKLAREFGGKRTYSIIHYFKGPDGYSPVGGVILDSSGNLYGTTQRGGANAMGTVFELSPSGAAWKEKVLYSFAAPPDVASPGIALTFDADGNLYGPASFGAYGYGGVFRLKPIANGWQETVIYNFTGGGDGESPSGQLALDSAGNLYGAAAYGGQYGDGVVFELTPSSNGDWTESVLYNFTGSKDGGAPAGGVVFDGAGNLYGTTQDGANSGCYGDGPGCGTAFELAPSMGNWTLTVLHAFDGSDGGTLSPV